MALTDYTTYAIIRGILGVASTEITDTVLAQPTWELQFELEMEDIDQGDGAVLTEYAAIVAIEAGSRTADQTRFYNLVNLLAAYSVARQLLTSVDMFAPKKITDGKAAVERTNDPYEMLRQGVLAGYKLLKDRLTTLLLVLVPDANVPAATARTNILSTGLGSDPVTGS